MPEPIEELFVRMGYDAGSWLDDFEADLDKAVEIGQEKGLEISDAVAQGLAEGWGQRVAETATELGVNIEGVAASLVKAGEAAGYTQEQLIQMAKAYQQDLLRQWDALIVQATVDIARTGQVAAQTAKALEELNQKMAGAHAGSQKMGQAVQVSNKALASGQESTQGWTRLLQPLVGALGQGGQQAAALGSQVVGLTTTVGVAAGAFTILGFGLKELIELFGEANAAAIVFSATNFRMQAAIRANQRVMGEAAGTTAEWRAFADDLSKTLGIQRAEVYRTVQSVQSFAVGLNLTKDEMMGLTQAAAGMSITTGQDMNSALRQMIFYIQTGAPRALRYLQISIKDTTLNLKAQELQLGATYKALTDQEKVLVRQAALMDEVGRRTEDVAAGTGILAEQYQAMDTQLETATTLLGGFLAPTILSVNKAWTDFKTNIITTLTVAVLGAQELWAQLTSIWDGLVAYNQAYKDNVASGMGVVDAFNAAVATGMEAQKESAGKALEDLMTAWNEAWGNMADVPGEPESVQTWQEAVDAAFGQVTASLADLEDDWDDEWDKIEARAAEAMKKLDDSISRQRTDAWQSYNDAINDINRDAAEDRLQTTADYQIEERRATEDHLRRLKEMEQQYLFDLEDAVRERDARQVLLLQRRYNTERQKEGDDFDLAAQRRKQDFQRQMAEIGRQQQIKLAERKREYDAEIDEIRIEGDRRRAELEEQHKKEQEDLQRRIDEKIALMIEETGAFNNLTVEQLRVLREMLERELGPGGPHDAVVTGFIRSVIDRLNAARTALAAFYASVGYAIYRASETQGSFPVPGRAASGGGRVVSGRIGGYQAGGSFVATSPQLIQVGERPERVDVTPMNTGNGSPLPGFGRAGGGKVQVEVGIRLGDGLEGDLIDQAMSEVADVMVNMVRSEPVGFGGAARTGGRQ